MDSPEVVDWDAYQVNNQPAINSEARMARNVERVLESIYALERNIGLWFEHFERRLDVLGQNLDLVNRRVAAVSRKTNNLDDKITEVDSKIQKLEDKIDEVAEDLLDSSSSDCSDSSDNSGTIRLRVGTNVAVCGQLSLSPIPNTRADE